jgi:two-component system, OmpR family, phosphate regulon sensor histidine kinase PhoR
LPASADAAANPPVVMADTDGEAGRFPLGAFVNAIEMPLIILDGEQRVLAASPGARTLLPGLIIGKAISLALRDPDILAALERVSVTGRSERAELNEPTPPERSLRLSLSALPRQVWSTPLTVMSLEDLSEVKTTERMRVDFIANASHELRTPLATLLGFIETLQGPARNDPAARERFLGIMNDQGRRMSRLIDDLLSLSRIEQRAHLAPQDPVDLVAIVREIIDSLSVVASERGVTVEGPGMPTAGRAVEVPGDRDELLRLVENLVENAIKYGQDGQRVEVEVMAEDRNVVLTVRDHGPGIAAEHIPRLTERFYRVDVGASREAGGTGLGLAIVKHIVLRHRGRMTVESQPGQGARFRVSLPRLT